MSTLNVNTIRHNTSGFNNVVAHADGAGTENATHCRAWVNFNGTGVVAIRDDFNVSSITDNGTGDYTVNFSNALSDANYSTLCTTDNGSPTSGNGNILGMYSGGTYSTTAVRVSQKTPNSPTVPNDLTICNVAVFR